MHRRAVLPSQRSLEVIVGKAEVRSETQHVRMDVDYVEKLEDLGSLHVGKINNVQFKGAEKVVRIG